MLRMYGVLRRFGRAVPFMVAPHAVGNPLAAHGRGGRGGLRRACSMTFVGADGRFKDCVFFACVRKQLNSGVSRSTVPTIMRSLFSLLVVFAAESAHAQSHRRATLFDLGIGLATVHGARYMTSAGPSIDVGLAVRGTQSFARFGARGQVGPPVGDQCVRESPDSACLRELPMVRGLM